MGTIFSDFFSKVWVPHPPPYKENAGLEYAQELARRTQGLSLYLTLLGWLCVVLGAILAIAGSVLGSTSIDPPISIFMTLAAHRGLLCSTLAIIFAGSGWQILDRASAATRVASISTHAILIASTNTDDSINADKSAYDACVKAKASWLEGRMNNDRLASIVETLTPSKAKQSKTNHSG